VTTASVDSLRILGRALDQAGDVLDHVRPDVLEQPTPCADWDVGALADHLINAPRQFLMMLRGEDPDFGAAPPHVSEGWGPAFRVAADDLIHEWHDRGGEAPMPAEWQVAELAVHTWDLATAVGVPVGSLDPQVAATGLEFMRASLTDDNRGGAFGPEQQAPQDADAYARLAAFAGRPA
jgi:uncharacterized protein (TIGR03086 family)